MKFFVFSILLSIVLSNELQWWQKTIIYQIYPKSFRDSNGDGYGDLRGIIEKLDYLNSLGVKTIWLNPIYPSGGKDGGYDVTSYVDIDSLYGTMNDFDDLISELHKRDMYLIMDFIPNHTSDKHPWFIESCKGNNRYRDYYVWKSTGNSKEPPNNWQSVFSNSSWEYNQQRNEWYLHQFLKEQPDLNMRSVQVQNEIKDVIRFWLKTKKVDGLRVDAMSFVFEDEEFRNEPIKSIIDSNGNTYDSLDHIYTFGHTKNYEFVTELRELVDSISLSENRTKCFFIEAYDTANNLRNYYKYNTKIGAHFSFNFQFIQMYPLPNERYHISNVSFTPLSIKNLMDPWIENRPDYVWPNWQIGNHDNARVATRIGREYVDLANALVLLIGGTAITYYGEEIGMEDLPMDSLRYDQVQDEYGKKYGPKLYQIYTRDYLRSPMQWSSNDQNAGFAPIQFNKTWLPVHPNYRSLNVNEQLNSSLSHLNIYKKLVDLRRQENFLNGSFEYGLITGQIFSFIRQLNDKLSLVIMNLSNKEASADFSQLMQRRLAKVDFYFNQLGYLNRYRIGNKIRTNGLRLDPFSCLILS